MPTDFKQLKNYFVDDTYATTLVTILFDIYGPEVIHYDPMTVTLDIKDDMGVEVSDKVNDKIQAGFSLLASEIFHEDVNVFTSICDILNNSSMDGTKFSFADSLDCAWGVTEARLLEGKLFGDFNEQIKDYVGLTLFNEGIYSPPTMLKFADYPNKQVTDMLIKDPVLYDFYRKENDYNRNQLEVLVDNKLTELLKELNTLPLDINKSFLEKQLQKKAS